MCDMVLLKVEQRGDTCNLAVISSFFKAAAKC